MIAPARIITILLALAASLLLIRPAVADKVYTWTDADGNIHISDRPPADGSSVDSVIDYSIPPEKPVSPDSAAQQKNAEAQRVKQLSKRLKRLKERQAQLETIIAENQASIAAAQKDADYYRRRSGSYARRNVKAIERQLVVLKNNLTTYQSDLGYIAEDIAEIDRIRKAIESDF
jgi:predicted RNase H-like nuclease (RuvC/YqgF family)